MNHYNLIQGNALALPLRDKSIHCCVTSPPYFGLRDYGTPGQLGLEPTPAAYVASMVAVFREVWRVLRDDGTLWLNLGDSYAANPGQRKETDKAGEKQQTKRGSTSCPSMSVEGLAAKQLIGIPWRVAFALQDDGWYLRSDIIWSKPNPMPESVTDRPTKAHEYLFLLAKSEKYYYDADAIKERSAGESPVSRMAYGLQQKQANITGRSVESMQNSTLGTPANETRNRRSVWTVATQPFNDWQESVHWNHVIAGELCDGMKHKVFLDCPLHASVGFPETILRCGEHEGDGLNHIDNTGDRPGREQSCGCASTGPNHDEATTEQSLGLPLPPCSLTATCHSTQSRKTDLVPETSPACMAYEENPSHIPDKSETPFRSEPDRGNGGCNTFVVETAESQSNQMTVRTVDIELRREFYGASVLDLSTAGCTCQFYRKETKKTSHFATFPPKLIEPCILAGCPKGGTVLDPFNGSGTTGAVAIDNGRNYVGIELNSEYIEMSQRRIYKAAEQPRLELEVVA